ncbi:unnamed protein product [Staurois parvus]|uniref:Uncharacterized protein n=1 Tax=Staurois parvus TaxID=386267 RepID=A0ABN9B432_9NEOB|nr:unnamed protein product [Staurois parvus]
MNKKVPPSSSVGRRLSRVQWQSGGAEAASIEGPIHRPRLKRPPSSSVGR